MFSFKITCEFAVKFTFVKSHLNIALPDTNTADTWVVNGPLLILSWHVRLPLFTMLVGDELYTPVTPP